MVAQQREGALAVMDGVFGGVLLLPAPARRMRPTASASGDRRIFLMRAFLAIHGQTEPGAAAAGR